MPQQYLPPLNISLTILGILFFGLLAYFILFCAIRTRKLTRSLSQEPDVVRLGYANSFGQESIGMRQFRGLGILTLREKSITFDRVMPRRTTAIPLDRITGVDMTKSHLGKTKFQPLLKVSFRNETGAQDSMAWLVQNPEDWIKALTSLKPPAH